MNKSIFFLLVFLSGFPLYSEAMKSERETTYYYSSVEFVETPLSYFKGSIPLSKEVALTRNHYRFTYDEKNRLKTIAFFNGKTPRSPNHTANLFLLAHRLEVNYSAATEVISFYDKKGRATEVLGNCHRFVYQLNDMGLRESLHFEAINGDRIENSWNIYTYHWLYEPGGAVIEDRFNRAGEQVSIRPRFKFYRLRLYFNPLGHIALMQNIDQEGKLVENASGAAQDQITTNAAGNFIQWQVLDRHGEPERGNGPNVAKGTQSFNEYGYEVRLENRDEKDQLIFSNYGICVSETEFDSWGNIKERRFYDTSGAPTLHRNAGYFQFKMFWDRSGNFRNKTEYYDVEGRPTTHQERGYHRVRFQYDDKKNLIQISYHNTFDELVNRKDNGIAVIKYEYDRNGKRKMIRYSKDHRILKD